MNNHKNFLWTKYMKWLNPTMMHILNWLGAVALSVIVSLLLKNHLTESVRFGISFFVMFEAMFPIVKHYVIKNNKDGNKLSGPVLFLKYSIGAFVGGIVAGLLIGFLNQY